jgi:predicted DCC family thiol-disulfide oxidoreductase YuxK
MNEKSISFKNVRKDIVLYDGYCIMCNRARRFTEALDWFHKIEFVDIYDKERIRDLSIEVPDDEDLLKDIHLLGKNGVLYRGFYTWRRILTLLPVTFIPSLLLYVPVVPLIGSRLYRFIADHRTRIHDGV